MHISSIDLTNLVASSPNVPVSDVDVVETGYAVAIGAMGANEVATRASLNEPMT